MQVFLYQLLILFAQSVDLAHQFFFDGLGVDLVMARTRVLASGTPVAGWFLAIALQWKSGRYHHGKLGKEWRGWGGQLTLARAFLQLVQALGVMDPGGFRFRDPELLLLSKTAGSAAKALSGLVSSHAPEAAVPGVEAAHGRDAREVMADFPVALLLQLADSKASSAIRQKPCPTLI